MIGLSSVDRVEGFDSIGMHQERENSAQSVGRAMGRGHVVTLMMLVTVVGTLRVLVTTAEARVKTVCVAVPEVSVTVLSIVSKCIMNRDERMLT
jgi:hypothetical protein